VTFQMPRFGLSDADLDDLMRFDLLGISTSSYYRLLSRGFVSAECHRTVVAAITARRGLTAGQVQASLGDHLYVIGESGASVAKIGRSVNVSARLRQLAMGSPVTLIVQHVEPGLGRAEAAVHRVLDSRRLHGEWFGFADDEEPGKVVREALLTLPELAWLRGLTQAVEAARGELEAGGPPRSALAALAAVRDPDAPTELDRAARIAAENENRDCAVAEAERSLWRSLGATKRPAC
jgi:Meiotically up-regulated gene 113